MLVNPIMAHDIKHACCCLYLRNVLGALASLNSILELLPLFRDIFSDSWFLSSTVNKVCVCGGKGVVSKSISCSVGLSSAISLGYFRFADSISRCIKIMETCTLAFTLCHLTY